MTLASCGPTGNNFLANGPGTQLEATDINTARELNRKYFNYLCQESGLIPGSLGEPYYSCYIEPGNQKFWTLITYQGLNDIDRRCDAYLQWLDNKKRSKAPILSQLGSMGTATGSIMQIAGVTSDAITIVGIAFDLISKSVENYHSRLLLEVESSTVNSVVLNARRRFREHLLKEKVQIANKPQAEHVLRSYLRLCLPFSIEANINNFSTLGSAGITPDEKNSIDWTPVVGNPLDPNQKFGSGGHESGGIQPGKDFDKVFVNPSKYGQKDLKLLQDAFCLQGQGVGKVGSKTLASIKIFEEVPLNPVHFPNYKAPIKNGLIDDSEFQFITAWGDCNNKKYKNMYERVKYEIIQKNTAENNLKALIGLLNTRFGKKIALDSTLESSDLREAIKNARTAYGLPDYNGFASDQVTQKLDNSLRKGAPPPTSN